MLRLRGACYAEMVGLALDGLPEEVCGLLVGDPGRAVVEAFHPCRNVAASSRVYSLDPREHLRIERAAEEQGLEVIGVMHSHTHTDAYPSPTDVAQAPDPSWHYVIVSLRDDAPVLRSYRIVDEAIREQPVTVLR